jgi:hypothetical protein
MAELSLARQRITILQGRHKGSGLSAKIVQRILASPILPPNARDAILVYAREKIAGTFGHGERERRKFASRLNGNLQLTLAAELHQARDHEGQTGELRLNLLANGPLGLCHNL